MRNISEISVGDIQMQKLEKTTRMNEFLTTRQLNLLNLPTTLADVFEFMTACDIDFANNLDSTLWTFLKFLSVAEMIGLRRLCRSSSQLVDP